MPLQSTSKSSALTDQLEALAMSGPVNVCREQDVGGGSTGELAVGDGQPGDGQPEQDRHQRDHPRLDPRTQVEGGPADGEGGEGDHQAEGRRPAQVPERRPGEEAEFVRVSEPRPVQSPRPTKTRAPMPAAKIPGKRTNESSGPPSPTASIMNTAATIGEPKMVPQRGETPGGGEDRLGHHGAVADQHGQDGQPAAERDEGSLGSEDDAQAQAAQRGEDDPGEGDRLGHARGERVGLVMCRVPGRYWMNSATKTPLSARREAHHTGSPWKPRAIGNEVKNQPCRWLTSWMKPKAATEMGAPRRAASTSRRT